MFRMLRENPIIGLIGIAQLMGMLASTFLSLYLAVNFAEKGFWPVTIYFETWLIPADLVLFPIFYIVMKKTSPRAVTIAAMICQAMGLGLIAAFPGNNNPWLVGPTVALFATGFWQIHHLAMAAHTSHLQRGSEVSFLAGISELGILLGASSAAVLASLHWIAAPQYIAFFLQSVATIALGCTLPKTRHEGGSTAAKGELGFDKIWASIRQYPRQTLGVAVGAVYELLVAMLMSSWLVSAGFPVLFLGGMRMLSAIATFALTPFFGRLIQQQRGGEFKLSCLAGVFGWTLAIFLPDEKGILIATLIWPLSAYFLKTGLESRWYSRRSSTQILTRSLILACVRLPCLVIFCWLATRHPEIYPVAGLLVALLILPYGIYLLRSEKEAAI